MFNWLGEHNTLVILLLAILAMISLSRALFIPLTRPQRAGIKQLKRQMENLRQELGLGQEPVSLIRKKRIDQVAPQLKKLERLALFEHLTLKLERAGSELLGSQYALRALGVATALGLAGGLYLASLLIGLLVLFCALALAYGYLSRREQHRLEQIESQFPDALDVLKRALGTGYALNDALKLVADEMPEPIRNEFRVLFADINYGQDIRRALMGLVERVPSVTTSALATTILIQKETGGKLSEKIDSMARVIRSRFQFNRKIRTFSASGRLSAWILILLPFAMFALLMSVAPDYIGDLLDSGSGRQALLIGVLGMIAGIIWIGRLIRIEV